MIRLKLAMSSSGRQASLDLRRKSGFDQINNLCSAGQEQRRPFIEVSEALSPKTGPSPVGFSNPPMVNVKRAIDDDIGIACYSSTRVD